MATKKELEEQKKNISKFEQRFRRSSAGMGEKHSKWKVLDTFDRGEQWNTDEIPPWVPKPVSNMMRYIRRLKRANLALNIPYATFSAEFIDDVETVLDLQKAYRHVWDTSKVHMIIRSCINRALIEGTAIAQVYNDDTYVGGRYYGPDNPSNKLYQGKICVKRIQNPNFFPDPDAYRLEDMKYCTVTDNLPLSTIKNNPKFKEFAGKRLEKYVKNGEKSSFTAEETGQIYNRDNKLGNDSLVNEQGDEMVTLMTHWERFVNEQGAWQVNTYYWIKDADFLLYMIDGGADNANVIDEYPFAVLYDEEEDNDFWGTSELMDILEDQKIINKVDQVASMIGTLHQNPQKVVWRESGINAQEVARTGNLPGKTYMSNVPADQAMSYLKTPDIPRGVFELKDRKIAEVKDRTGTTEAYTGESVGSLTTSTGVNTLVDRATVRDRDKMLQIDAFVERISHLIMKFIVMTWDKERPIANQNPDGTMDYSTFEPLEPLTVANLEWRVKSNIYAKAPMTQATKQQQADKLMQMQGQFQFPVPIITPEEWVQMQDFDLAPAMLQRMKKDREKLEAQQNNDMAAKVLAMSDAINQLRTQGYPEEQLQQYAYEMANNLLQNGQQAPTDGTRPRDAAQQAQAPQGTTGSLAMNAMAQGM